MRDELDFAFSAFEVESTTKGMRLAIFEVSFLKRMGALLAFEITKEDEQWIVSGDFCWFCFFTFEHK